MIVVDETGAAAVNQRPVASYTELATLLGDALAARSDKTIFVQASGAASYGTVVAAMDVAKGAGADRIGLISNME